MSQLRKVNLGNNKSTTPKMMTHEQVTNYEDDKQQIINTINSIANLLNNHNEKIAPIVESYKRRNNNG